MAILVTKLVPWQRPLDPRSWLYCIR